MATYVVELKLPYERASSRFAVLHSTTDTMFSPTFDESEELVAHMFAEAYSGPASFSRDYSEDGQETLVASLRAFLTERFPNYQKASAPLPEAWQEALATFYEVEEPSRYDASDVVSWYQDADQRADMVQEDYRAWKRGRA